MKFFLAFILLFISFVSNCLANDVIFFKNTGNFIMPQIIFYAKRNIASYKNIIEAKSLLELNGSDRGVVFTVNNAQDRIDAIEYIYLNN